MLLELIIEVYCLSNGIIRHKDYKKYETYYFIILVIYEVVMSTGLIIAYFQSPYLIYKTQLIAWLWVPISALFSRIVVYIHKEELLVLATKLSENSVFGITNILDKVKRKIKYKVRFLIVLLYITSTLELFTSLLHFFTKSNVDYNDPDLYLIPYFFMFWQLNSFKGFLFHFSMQSIFAVPEIISSASPLFFLWYVIVSLEVHLEEFRNHAKNMPIFRPENGRVFDARKNEIMLSKVLQDLVKLQQYILRYITDFINFSKWMINVLMTYFIGSLIIFSFLSASHNEINGDMVSVMRSLASTLSLVYSFYIACYLGEVINKIHEFLLLSFYDTAWYNLPPRLREYILIPMIQSQYAKSVKVFNMHVINLNLYYKTMRNIYAIVNAMLLIQRKNVDIIKNN